MGTTGLPQPRRVRRRTPDGGTALPDFGLPRAARRHAVAGVVLTALAALLVLFAFLAPDDLNSFSPQALVRVPVEGLIIAAFVLVLPPRPRRVVAVLAG